MTRRSCVHRKTSSLQTSSPRKPSKVQKANSRLSKIHFQWKETLTQHPFGKKSKWRWVSLNSIKINTFLSNNNNNDIIDMQLDGRDPDVNKRFSVIEQVNNVLKEAMDIENLSLMYEGWTRYAYEISLLSYHYFTFLLITIFYPQLGMKWYWYQQLGTKKNTSKSDSDLRLRLNFT